MSGLFRSRRLGIATLLFVGALGVIAVSGPSFGADPFSRDRPSASEPSRHSHELDELRRQDVAMQLAARGVPAVWQQQELAELIDWRERFDAARSLHEQVGIDLDWRVYSLPDLTDLRLRAMKAGELEAHYGIALDWQRYSWNDLERLRLSLVALHPVPMPQPALDADALAPFDPNCCPPNRRAPRMRPALHDRDAIVQPVFASTATIKAERGYVNRGPRAADPDGVVAPTFGRVPRRMASQPDDLQPDDLINPWQVGRFGPAR